jgi:hypothetical protein
MVQPFEPELRQARQHAVFARFADGEQARHPLGEQPACHESERLHRRAVEPLGVVDEAQQGLFLGDLRQEAECRETHQEAVGSGSGHGTERDAQRALLGLRERVEVI